MRGRLTLVAVAALVGALLSPAPAADALRLSPVASFDVTFNDLARDRTLPTRILYPTETRGLLPLIVFAHGAHQSGPVYDGFGRKLAERGFIVALPTFPKTNGPGAIDFDDYPNQRADVSFIITKMIARNDNRQWPLRLRLDTDYIGVAGHSLGAVTALGFGHPSGMDTRVKAIVAISGDTCNFVPPSNSALGVLCPPTPSYFDPAMPPVMYVHAVDDWIVPVSASEDAFAMSFRHRYLVKLNLGHHWPFGTVTSEAVGGFFAKYLKQPGGSRARMKQAVEGHGTFEFLAR